MIKQDTSNTSQALWIGIGSLCSFLFSIVSAAILSRYFTKDQYGTYKQVMYVYHTLLTVFTLGLPLAYSYFLPRVSKSEGKSLVNKLNYCFLLMGFVFSIVLYFGADLFAGILKNEELASNIRIFSLAPVFILPTMGLQGILATYKKTILNAIYVVSTRILMLICVALPVVIYENTVAVALWGFIISSFISCIIAFYFQNLPFRGCKKEKSTITYKSIFAYSLPLMVAGFLGIVINAADQFYVSRFFGSEVFADFANGSLELPFVSMVLSASGTVLLPVFSKMLSDNCTVDEVVSLWTRTAVKATYILYPIVVFCFFFAGDIMTFLYGEMYITSAKYFQIMLIVNLFTIIQFYPIILALGKTKEYALVHVILFVMVWSLEYLGVVLFSSPIVVTIISVACKILKILIMMKIVSGSLKISFWRLFPFKQMLSTLLCCIISALVSYYVVVCFPLPESRLLNLVIGFTIFATIVFTLGRWMRIDFLDVVRPITSKFIKW